MKSYKTIILFLISLAYYSPLKAVDAIKMTDNYGNETIFLLQHHPIVSYFNTGIEIKTTFDHIFFEGSILLFEFIEYNDASLETTFDEIPCFKIDQFNLLGKNLTPNTTLIMYDFSGTIIKQANIDQTGCIHIPLSNMKEGVYIIKSKDKNFKFYKR